MVWYSFTGSRDRGIKLAEDPKTLPYATKSFNTGILERLPGLVIEFAAMETLLLQEPE